MKLGFIGLGLMGDPMSMNLVKKSGKELLVFDPNPGAGSLALKAGGRRAENARELVSASDLVFSMVPNGTIVGEIYESVKTALRPGLIWADLCTIAPRESRNIAALVRERGAVFLDTPVVKSRAAALEGKLGIYAGGPEEAFEKIKPFLECMGAAVLYLGDNGMGLVMKLCHNMLVAQIQNGVNESLALARKLCGISPSAFARAAACGGAQNFYLDSKAPSIEKEDFSPAFSTANLNKDINLASELAAEAGLSLPGLDLVRERCHEMMARGLGPLDFSSSWKLFSQN
jgi:3-hydroxyisobutyrate dehydrogenase